VTVWHIRNGNFKSSLPGPGEFINAGPESFLPTRISPSAEVKDLTSDLD
jgi:hypothetical protein